MTLSVRLFVSSVTLLSLVTACGLNTETEKASKKPVTYKTENGLITSMVPSEFKRVPLREEEDKIFGDNDLTPVIQDGANIPAKYRPLVNAFGKISMGCTATHIGNNMVLTAGHCFEATEVRSSKACGDITVTWGFRKDKPQGVLTSKCTSVVAMQLKDNVIDYAIFMVDKAPDAKVEVDLSRRPVVGDKLTIFGHPQLRPLEWSKTCDMFTSLPGTTSRPWPWGGHFGYQCDTEGGNSGSTVLNDETLKVIGIHDGGSADSSNYATYLADTPLQEILNGPRPTPAPSVNPTVGPTVQPTPVPTVGPTPVPRPTVLPTPTPPPGNDLNFGPFENNENRVLTTLSTGEMTTFTLNVNTEAGFDKVTVTDGNGKSRTFSGKKSEDLALKTPVTVRFKSDRTVKSQSVSLTNIGFVAL